MHGVASAAASSVTESPLSIHLPDAAATEHFGARLGPLLAGGMVVTLRGELGSGMDRLATIGGILFVCGGVGDFIWHSLFGMEVNTEALLSPTHLMLATGGLLLTSTPARVAWRSRTREDTHPVASFAVVQSVTATVAPPAAMVIGRAVV